MDVKNSNDLFRVLLIYILGKLSNAFIHRGSYRFPETIIEHMEYVQKICVKYNSETIKYKEGDFVPVSVFMF